ncbi:hypothetical protein BC938DRAFT_482707 [Jimgerdemannia flammicorona]|uniref:Uncharacterized protein n=1 Tax=Jimgerdemannia flammicorona TaxID=994334 RepID=A0A433QWF1_9FUNG|nr:hypothetical protein BC938DRAFT_482707 [Jimgerdemannia flammicorona]
MFGAGLQGTSLSIHAEGPYLHASVQGVLRIPTGIWPFVLCQMPGCSLQGTSLSIRAEGPYLHPVFQYAVDCRCASFVWFCGRMFRDIVFDYLSSVRYKDWSIISMLQYIESKQELYVDMIDNIKKDIYTVLQSYEKSESVSKNAKKKMNRMLSAYDKLFSTVEVSQFKNKLRYKTEAEEHKTALRMKLTSACTNEDLKEFHANKRVVNQLVDGDDNSDRLTEKDVSEGENGECAASAEENRDTSMKMGNKADYAFVERLEHQDTSSHTKYWILSSGTNVQEVLANYVETIPESQKCSNPVYWGILDLTGDHPETKTLFSIEDWAEMVKSFHQDVKLSHTKVSDAICRFFDEVHKIVNDGNYPALAFDRLMPESIAKEYGIALTADDKRDINTLMLAIMTYAENLGDVDLPVSEAAFDNSFPNMLTRRFLDRSELKMDVLDYTFGMDCRATNLCRFGLLATTKLPATVRMLATLEAFYVLMLNFQTLKLICDRTNDIALSHSRAHRKRQTEDGEEDEAPENREIGGCFGNVINTPVRKRVK